MYTLGIETSCDETSCAILNNFEVLSNVTLSSLREHKKYGGVIPEIATRAHLKAMDRVLKEASIQADVPLKKIGLIGATCKPGLIGSLVVGLNFAKALSVALKVPFIGINHLHAHLFAPFLNCAHKLRFPFLGLVISGGHTEIYRVDDFNKIKTLGETLDDACGEVFDKVAMGYGLGYPGGPVIDRLYDQRYRKDFDFKCGRSGFDLSFSGIKTALIYKRNELKAKGLFDAKTKIRLISSFQYAVCETIIRAAREAAAKFKIDRIVCGGGVAANSYLRRRLKSEEKKARLEILVSPRKYAGDNGAMVAGLGFYLYNKRRTKSPLNLRAEPN